MTGENMTTEKLPACIGCKIIKAKPMDEVTFLSQIKHQETNQETRPGYLVIYPDGYTSWSPKDVFENAYRKVTPSEARMI